MWSLRLRNKVYQGEFHEITDQLYDDNDVSVEDYDFIHKLMLMGVSQVQDEEGCVFYEYINLEHSELLCTM